MTIPTDIQLGLLERKVGPIVTQRVGDNCNKRYKELHVIGKHKQISSKHSAPGLPDTNIPDMQGEKLPCCFAYRNWKDANCINACH